MGTEAASKQVGVTHERLETRDYLFFKINFVFPFFKPIFVISVNIERRKVMKKLTYLAMAMTASLALGLTACSKDDKDDNTNTGTTTQEERNDIDKAMESMSGVVASAMSPDGFMAQVSDKEFVLSLLPPVLEARNVFDVKELTKDGRFNYQAATGSYVWDEESSKWTTSAGENISLSFPSNFSSENNCNVTVNGYTDQAVTIDGRTAYVPTSTSAVFTKDGARLATMNFNATYSADGMPENVEVASYTKPIATTTALNRTSEKAYTFTTTSVDETTQSKISISAGFNVPENKEALENAVSDVVVTMSNNGLTLAGAIDAKALAELVKQGKRPTPSDINGLLDMNVEYAGRNVGKLNIEEGQNGIPALTIEYNDGTTQNANVLLNGVVDMMTEFDPAMIESILKMILK